MQNHKLRCLIEDREKNIAEMSSWPWDKTAKHIDLINQQMRWAYKQRNEFGMEILEEYWQQVVAARCRKLDAEMGQQNQTGV